MKIITTALFLFLLTSAARADDAGVRKAMIEALTRAKQLGGEGKPRPDHVLFQLYDVERAVAEAELGATISARTRRFRALRVLVRAGDRTADSGNVDASHASFMPHLFAVPLDDDPALLRADLVEAAERAYRRALTALEAKSRWTKDQPRRPEDAPFDLADVKAASSVQSPRGLKAPDLKALTRLVEELSAPLREVAAVLGGPARGQQTVVRRRVLSSEGSWVDERRSFVLLRVAAEGQADDRMPLELQATFSAASLAGLPPLDTMKKAVRALGADLVALRAAPVAEKGKAVVLFEAPAAGVLLRRLSGATFTGTPEPIREPGKKAWGKPNPLPSRLGQPVAPPFLDLRDDPLTELGPGKRPLFGAYHADDEGVPAEAITLVDKGVLRSLPMSRTPRHELPRSNGHARGYPVNGVVPGHAGSLFVSARGALAESALRARALAEAKKLGPGTPVYVIRSVKDDALEGEPDGPVYFNALRMAHGTIGMGGGRWQPPLLAAVAYRLRGSKLELVRGLSLFTREAEPKLEDLAAAGRDSAAYNFMDLPYYGGAGELGIPTSIVTPSLLWKNVTVEAVGRREPAVLYPAPQLSSH